MQSQDATTAHFAREDTLAPITNVQAVKPRPHNSTDFEKGALGRVTAEGERALNLLLAPEAPIGTQSGPGRQQADAQAQAKSKATKSAAKQNGVSRIKGKRKADQELIRYFKKVIRLDAASKAD